MNRTQVAAHRTLDAFSHTLDPVLDGGQSALIAAIFVLKSELELAFAEEDCDSPTDFLEDVALFLESGSRSPQPLSKLAPQRAIGGANVVEYRDT